MVFVTGGTGLIGAHLLYELVSAGEKVKALMRENSKTHEVLKIFSFYSGRPEEMFNRIEWVRGDILDYFGLEKLLDGVEDVYHCAAIVSFSGNDRKKMIHNNVEGTANIVNAAIAAGVKRFCHVSSVSALGSNQDGYIVDENTNWIPSKRITGYSASKFFSEMEVWRGIQEGLDAIIVLPSIVLGPGKWDQGSPQLFKIIWDGLKFYTEGMTGYVDVKDVSRAMFMMMDKNNFKLCKNQRFILNSENWSYRKILFQIADALGKRRPGYFASPFMLALAWRFSSLYSLLFNGHSGITREVADAACRVNRFDGSKITDFINYDYIPVSESIERTAKQFLKEIRMQG